MRTPPWILIADDSVANREILQARLSGHGYHILTAADGQTALAIAKDTQPDLILLDVMMPILDGVTVCRVLKTDSDLSFVPIIMVTARADSSDIVAGLEAGADEYVTKPIDQEALVARVKSMLRIKALHDTVQEQAARLEAQAGQLAELNRTLEQRVTAQVHELERVGRLKRFLSPHVADLIVSSGDEKFLEGHRGEITALFCDLRGSTAFSETSEPEDAMAILQEYHNVIGELILRFEGTLEHFAGDGAAVFFNDPLPCPDAPLRAVRMAVAIRHRVRELSRHWRRLGHNLELGIGIAQGYATMGKIGFEGGRLEYVAIGSVQNLASRLSDDAGPGQILITQRVYAAIEGLAEVEAAGELTLKGFARSVAAFNVVRLLDDTTEPL